MSSESNPERFDAGFLKFISIKKEELPGQSDGIGVSLVTSEEVHLKKYGIYRLTPSNDLFNNWCDAIFISREDNSKIKREEEKKKYEYRFFVGPLCTSFKDLKLGTRIIVNKHLQCVNCDIDGDNQNAIKKYQDCMKNCGAFNPQKFFLKKNRTKTPKRSKALKIVKRVKNVKSLKKRAKTPKRSKARKSVKNVKSK